MQEQNSENATNSVTQNPSVSIMDPSQWRFLVEEWKKSSNISLMEFCERHQVNRSSLNYWISKDKRQSKQKINFARVQTHLNSPANAVDESKPEEKFKAILPCGTQLELTTNDSLNLMLALIKELR